jgi:hypothetical protein
MKRATPGLYSAPHFPLPKEIRSKLPDAPLPAGLLGERDNDSRLTFFGHYWMEWPLLPLTTIHACVDASVAAGGRLAAYRFDGEPELAPERFVLSFGQEEYASANSVGIARGQFDADVSQFGQHLVIGRSSFCPRASDRDRTDPARGGSAPGC